MKQLPRWRMTGLVLFAYALIVGLMTWPALKHLNQGLIGKDVDTWIFFWNNWWFGEALTNGLNLFVTNLLFYPSGTSLIAHSNSFTSSLTAFFLEPIAGPAAAYNLTLLLGLWLGAVGMYLLVREITSDPLASFLAGFVFAFAPYHITQVTAHDHLGAIHWWPFFALFLRRTLQSGKWNYAAAAGLFAALTIWSGLQLGVLLFLWSLTYIAWNFWQHRSDLIYEKGDWKGKVSRLALLSAVTLILIAPLLWAIVSEWSAVTESAASYNEGLVKNTDLLAYFVPPKLNPLFGDQLLPQLERFGYSSLFSPYIGYGVLLLAIIAVFGWRKEAYFWLVTLVLWLIMALGSAFRFNGTLYEQIPLPFEWLGRIFPISTIRAPDRFNLLTIFSLSVLAGMGAAYLRTVRLWRWILLPLSLLIIIEFMTVPFPMWDLPPGSEFLGELVADESSFAVINYPLGYNNSKRWLYYQTLHGKPIVEGHVSRYTPETYAHIKEQPILSALYAGSERPSALPPDFFQSGDEGYDLGPALRKLAGDGFRYILVHNQETDRERLSHFQSLLPLSPVFQDDVLTVFDLTDPWPDESFNLSQSIAPGIDMLQAITSYDSSERELNLQLLTRLTGPLDEGPECKLELPGTPGGIFFDPLPVDADLQAGFLAVQTLRLAIPDSIDPGQHKWQIVCPDSPPVIGTDILYVGEIEISLLNPNIYLNFEELIELDGFRWWIEQSDLHLALRWRALTDIDTDYKVFVHLIEDEGSVVSQSDALHCDWGCPSSQWKQDEIVIDERTLPLFGLRVGEYKLAFGLYDGQTGERLLVQDGDGNVVQDAYFILDGVIAIPVSR